jgi:3-oxoacyl-[acyl-carrier protein] reductase
MTNQKIIVITGTSSGLGHTLAKTLLAKDYKVIGVSRRIVTSKDLGDKTNSYAHLDFDLSNIEGIPELCSALIQTYGKPYGLINNAAIGTDGLLPTMHLTEIEQIVSLNILSPIIMTKHLIRPMLQQRSGRVVNMSSIVAKTGYRGLSVYAASKAAMEGFTHSLARDVGSRGVTVNCIAPGFVDTEMTTSLDAESLKKIKRRAALGRFPSHEEVVGGVEYLLSESAAGITGTTITIDAGNTA